MFRFRRKQKGGKADDRQLGETIKQELVPYIKREELLEYFAKIENNKKKKELWDSLPARKKIKMLRYAIEKKGELDGKK